MGRHITLEKSEEQGNRMAEAIETFMAEVDNVDGLVEEVIEMDAAAKAWRAEGEK